MDYKQYVLPIISGSVPIGCGVLVNHYFITATHVIEKADNLMIKYDGVQISLKDPIIPPTDELEMDFTVYKFPSITSPLRLSKNVPTSGDVLTSCSYRVVPQGLEYVQSQVIVNDIQENHYFFGDNDVLLKEGSSGSPVFSEEDVVGILTRGKEGTGLCAFLSSKTIDACIQIIEALFGEKEDYLDIKYS